MRTYTAVQTQTGTILLNLHVGEHTAREIWHAAWSAARYNSRPKNALRRELRAQYYDWQLYAEAVLTSRNGGNHD